jgi:alanyl-tRNA synthetase
MLGALIDVMGEDYPELVDKQSQIVQALKQEELKFAETLEVGMQEYRKATDLLPTGDDIPGDLAFKLYDTFGFPLDLTQDVAREDGRVVDVAAFDRCMAEQKDRSRSSKQFTQANQISADVVQSLTPTEFTGYHSHSSESRVVMILQDGQPVDHLEAGQSGHIILDSTPFYAESGGQVGDVGQLNRGGLLARVTDTQKAAGQFHLHAVSVEQGAANVNQTVTASIDQQHRSAVILNHSATHLLHKVLRDVLGDHVQQKGSLVNADKLRFDFSHNQPIDAATLKNIECQVNAVIRSNYHAKDQLMSYDQAISSGAMALFGEKYGDEVRVMDFGGFSVELCGGTHVHATGDIGLFKITQETSVASGIRRIEAITGAAAFQFVSDQEVLLKELSAIMNSPVEQLSKNITGLIEQNKAMHKELDALHKAQASESMGDVLSEANEVGGIHYLTRVFDDTDVNVLRDSVDGFKSKYESGIVVFANVIEGKAQVLVGVTKGMTSDVKAGQLIKEILSAIGGRGGGRPDFAQGGGAASSDQLRQVIDDVMTDLQSNMSN